MHTQLLGDISISYWLVCLETPADAGAPSITPVVVWPLVSLQLLHSDSPYTHMLTNREAFNQKKLEMGFNEKIALMMHSPQDQSSPGTALSGVGARTCVSVNGALALFLCLLPPSFFVVEVNFVSHNLKGLLNCTEHWLFWLLCHLAHMG